MRGDPAAQTVARVDTDPIEILAVRIALLADRRVRAQRWQSPSYRPDFPAQ